MKSNTRKEQQHKKRYEGLDVLRGIVIISMILYHASWDLVYIAGFEWKWFETNLAYIWQQSICWTFILLSGFCWSLGRHQLRRGFTVFCGGLLVTLVTICFLPEERVIFGILTLLGVSMLILIPLDKLFCKIPAQLGLLLSVMLFFITYDSFEGYLGFQGLHMMKLPGFLYQQGCVSSFFGFMEPHFFSTDYFPLIPWCFLFFSGYFIYHWLGKKINENSLNSDKVEEPINRQLPQILRPFAFLGRHSLVIYLLHQPILYFLLMIPLP